LIEEEEEVENERGWRSRRGEVEEAEDISMG